MVLDELTLHQRVADKGFDEMFIAQNIARLHRAKPGEVLFFTVHLSNSDIIDTLLYLSGTKYVKMSSPNVVRYCKA